MGRSAPGREGDTADRALALDGFRKGVAWVNGFCLGRHWSRGPQRTLAVPGPVLRAGTNEVVVEVHASASREACLCGEPDLGHTRPDRGASGRSPSVLVRGGAS